MKNNIVLPTFENAQELYKNYSTIESLYILTKNLKKSIDQNYLDNYKFLGTKGIYNRVLLDYYPNEAVIKSEFIKQVLIKGKTHVAIFELPVINSRADLCKINSGSIAYEIKTDLDSFTRLEKQLNDYYQIFDEVFVICSTNRLKEMVARIPNETGVFSYKITKNKKYIFKKERRSKQNRHINSEQQLKSLQNNELYSLMKDSKNKSRESVIDYILDSKTKDEINFQFKRCLKFKYFNQWNFFKQNYEQMLEIDYQWFYKNLIEPSIIYHYD